MSSPPKRLPSLNLRTAKPMTSRRISSYRVDASCKHYRLDLLNESVQEKRQSRQYKANIGVQGKLELYESFKERVLSQEQSRSLKLDDTPVVAYMREVEKNKLSPKSIGVVYRQNKTKTMELQHCSIGDQYARALSKGLEHTEGLDCINLASNRLTDRGLLPVLASIDFTSLKELSLSNNSLGDACIAELAKHLSRGSCNVASLYLEKTHLSKTAVTVVCDALIMNKSVTSLCLAKNSLDQNETLTELLKANDKIEVLDLHWNSLKDPQFFEALAENQSIKELDVSWNSLGRNSEVLGSIQEFFVANTTVRHLDLSYNYFTYSECSTLSEAVKANQTLLGLHMLGNHATVNTQGHIVPTLHIQNKQRYVRMLLPSNFRVRRDQMNCWVCERWIEMRFEHTDAVPEEKVFIHFGFNEFQPEEMLLSDTGVHYLDRAVPPERVQFYFTAHGQPLTSTNYSLKKTGSFAVQNSQQLNCIKRPSGPVCTVSQPFVWALPRPKVFCEHSVINEEQTEPSSQLFQGYMQNSSQLYTDCLAADLKEARIDQLVPSSEAYSAVVQVLKENYGRIRIWYKTLASHGNHKVVSVGYSVFKDFLKKCGVFGGGFNQSVLGVHWGAVSVPKNKDCLFNPATTLVRYKFVEMLVRIAIEKYCRNSVPCSVGAALTHLLEMISCCVEETDQWRNDQFLQPEIEEYLEANQAGLETVYRRYYAQFGSRLFMSAEGFREMLLDASVFNDCFGMREADACFYQSMMTQVDELRSSRHLEMSFLEFLEAVARAAQRANLTLDHKDPLHQQAPPVALLLKLQAFVPRLLHLTTPAN